VRRDYHLFTELRAELEGNYHRTRERLDRSAEEMRNRPSRPTSADIEESNTNDVARDEDWAIPPESDKFVDGIHRQTSAFCFLVIVCFLASFPIFIL
jgi:hypothetical protein